MAKWLVKSEPSSWSFDQQVAAGAKGTTWNGVRNHTAKQYLMAMKKGDEAFFYHSNEGKAVVGIVKVVKTYYPDPTDASGKFGMVDFAVVRPLPQTGDAGRDQGGADARRHDSGQELPPLGSAGHRRRVGHGARDGGSPRAGVGDLPTA